MAWWNAGRAENWEGVPTPDKIKRPSPPRQIGENPPYVQAARAVVGLDQPATFVKQDPSVARDPSTNVPIPKVEEPPADRDPYTGIPLPKVGEGKTITATAKPISTPMTGYAAGFNREPGGLYKDTSGNEMIYEGEGSSFFTGPSGRRTSLGPNFSSTGLAPDTMQAANENMRRGGGGGSLGFAGEYSGPTSTTGMTDAQKAAFEEQRQADIQKNVGRLNEQSDLLRTQIANQRAAQGVTPRTAGSDIARPTMQDDLQDYMRGAVGTEGYRRIRNMQMDYNAQRDEAMKGLDRKGRAAVADEFAQNNPIAQIIRAGAEPQDTGYDPYQMARLGIESARFQADRQDQARQADIEQQKMEREDWRFALDDRKQMQNEVNDYVKRASERQDVDPVMNQMLISDTLRLSQKHGIPPDQVDNKIRAELARAQAAATGQEQRALTAADIQKVVSDTEAQILRNRAQ